MSDLRSMEEGFEEMIPNPAGIPVKEKDSDKIREEHSYWKMQNQQISKKKTLKHLEYWQVVSSCSSL